MESPEATLSYIHPGIRKIYLPESALLQSRDRIKELEELLEQANQKIDELSRLKQAVVVALEAECVEHLQAQRDLAALQRRSSAAIGFSPTRNGWNVISRVWPFAFLEEQARNATEDLQAVAQARVLRERDIQILEKDRVIEELRRRLQSMEIEQAAISVVTEQREVAEGAPERADTAHSMPSLPTISTALAGTRCEQLH